MLIAQISDTHILAKSSGHPKAASRAENLRRCIADIGRLDPRPDIVLFTGDTVQTGTPEDYDHLKELIVPLQPPIYATPGNRDDRENFHTAFGTERRDAPFMHYTVEDLPVRLVALDSIGPGHNLGVFCADRQRWLDDALASAPDRPTILFIHHPPFDLGTFYVDGYKDPDDREGLAAVVARHPQVRRLLCGHCHRSSQRAWAGTEATTMASIACDVRYGVDAPHLAETPIYQLHAVSEDGTVTTRSQLALD